MTIKIVCEKLSEIAHIERKHDRELKQGATEYINLRINSDSALWSDYAPYIDKAREFGMVVHESMFNEEI